MTHFEEQTQKERRAYADFYGVEIGEVYYCDICGYWTHNDEDGWGLCQCF